MEAFITTVRFPVLATLTTTRTVSFISAREQSFFEMEARSLGWEIVNSTNTILMSYAEAINHLVAVRDELINDAREA